MTSDSLAQQTHNSPEEIIQALGSDAQAAASALAQSPTDAINKALNALADVLIERTGDIIKANEQDVSKAKAKELSPAMIDRLTLDQGRIQAIAQSVRDISALDDPAGDVLEETTRPNGLIIQKVSVPIGVLGMIYESRPNVTIDAAALCLKSHNAVILRGGSESFHTSHLFHSYIQEVLEQSGIPKAAVAMIPETDRAYVSAMLAASDVIDVMIPRGGKGLTGRVMDEAKMAVFAHLDGNCHIYVHHEADPNLALEVIENAKLRRTGICGAVESILFDSALSDDTAKNILANLIDKDCTIYGDDKTQSLNEAVQAASNDDWSTEYLDKKISCKFVNNIDEAISHINHYGSHHTDCILTSDNDAAQAFLNRVDSAIVMHNSSTQFADGGEFGMGAEIGIGTGKLHARGPVGLKQLTTFKYMVRGTGQTRP